MESFDILLKMDFSPKIITNDTLNLLNVNINAVTDLIYIFVEDSLKDIQVNFMKMNKHLRFLLWSYSTFCDDLGFENLQRVVMFSSGRLYSCQPESSYENLNLELISEKEPRIYRKFFNYPMNIMFSTDDNCRYFLCPLITTFAYKFNANLTISYYQNENDTIKNLMNSFDVSSSDRQKGYLYHRSLEYTFPTIIVPNEFTRDDSEYFILPFQSAVWIITTAMIIYFAGALSISFWILTRKFDFMKHLIDSIRLSLTHSVNLHQTSFRIQIIYIQMAIYGFILTSIYSSYLGSYYILSAPSSNYRIACTEDIINLFEPTVKQKINFWQVDIVEYNLLFKSLNTKYGYCIYSTQWFRRFSFQRITGNYIFRLINNYGQISVPLHPYVREDAFYIDQLNNFVLDMYSCGLMEKWNSGTSLTNVSKKVIANLKPTSADNKVTISDLRYPLIWYGFGTSVSIVLAVLEYFIWFLQIFVCQEYFNFVFLNEKL